MERPTYRETKRVLESIQILNSETSISSLPDRLLSAVGNTVRTEITAFDRWEGPGVHAGTEWFDPPDSLPSSLLEIFNAHVGEHPLVPKLVDAKTTETLRITDCIRFRDFERTGLFNEFYTLVGVQHQMSTRLEIEPELAYSCTLSRSRRDFAEHDRAALDLLKPHLVNAIRIARELAKLRHDLDLLETITTKGILVLSMGLKPNYVNRAGTSMLDRFFGKQRSVGLPDELVRFIKSEHAKHLGNAYALPAELIISGPYTAGLHCRVAFDDQAGEISVIFDERRDFGVDELRAWGLTERQAEILLWAYKGKSDEMIGLLCGISTRTVQKHLEHIFRKLGVESRLSAIQLTREFLNRQ
jgi:DNA-binding CsgD family transcriptional regulator